MLLDTDPFLNELNKMYERQKGSGTVWVTMKRTDMKPKKSKAKDKVRDPTECKCLIRASDGKRHISTCLIPAQQVKFQQAMNVIMKAHMDALKKREKVKPSKEAKEESRK